MTSTCAMVAVIRHFRGAVRGPSPRSWAPLCPICPARGVGSRTVSPAWGDPSRHLGKNIYIVDGRPNRTVDSAHIMGFCPSRLAPDFETLESYAHIRAQTL